MICATRARAAAGVTLVSTSIVWSALTMTMALLMVVIVPVPVAKKTPSAIFSNRYALRLGAALPCPATTPAASRPPRAKDVPSMTRIVVANR